MVKKIYSLLIVLGVVFGVAADCCLANEPIAVSDGHIVVPSLLFKRFYSSNGLPDERIRSIFQDHSGYLWIGTMNGICRYDGFSFKNFFKTNNNNSIAGNWAYAITEDAQHNIWIATNVGFSKFDQQKETFTNYTLPNTKETQLSKRVNTLQFDENGMLWMGSKFGLIQYNPVSNTFKQYKDAPLATNICKITKGVGHFLWIATDKGVVHYNIENNKFDFFNLQIKPNAYGDKIWGLLETQNKDLYIATASNGLMILPYSLNFNSYGAIQTLNKYQNGSLENTQVFDICKSNEGNLWLGTEKGLVKIAQPSKPSASIAYYRNNAVNDKSISSDRVYCVYIDKTNVLWGGTEIGLNNLHLSTLPFNYFSFSNLRLTDQVRGVYSENGKDVWLATYKSGIYNYSGNSGNTKSFIFQPENSFLNGTRSVITDEQNVYIGTLDGIVKISKKSNANQLILKGHAVFSLYKDKIGNIWVGTNNGLFKILTNGATKDYVPAFAAVKTFTSSFIRTIFEDYQGRIWIGFENGGVAYVDKKLDKPVPVLNKENKEMVFGRTIYSITEYPKNTLWFGSESGLTSIQFTDESTNFSTAIVKDYSVQNGLPDKSVNGILSDEQGNLWISSIKGLVKFNIKNQTFQNYLPNIYFNHSSCYKYNNHQFYFGTSDGYIEFDPAKIVEDKFIPDISISDIKLFNQSIKIDEQFNGDVILSQSLFNTKKIIFNHKNNVFTLDFAALHFANPEQNKFAYKMEGFDKSWIQTTAQNRSATYTNLDPGNYVFKIKAANYLGIWNNTPVQLTITILPPPWKTWWAITLYILFFIVFIYYFTIYVLEQIKQRHQLQYEQLEKTQLKNLDALKTQFFTDISHEFRTPLSLIVGPAEEMLHAKIHDSGLKHKIQLIHRNSKKLMYLIDELMTFQKLDQGKLQLKPKEVDMFTFAKDVHNNFEHLAEKKDINFSISSDKRRYLAMVDAGKMEMVLNNLLFNAFKFVPQGGTIKIKLEYCDAESLPSEPNSNHKGNWLKLSVEDNGKGISATDFSHLFERYFQSDSAIKGTGVGLSLTKNLVELHGGIITANSEPGVKTSFAFYLPLIAAPVISNVPIEAEEIHYQLDYDVNDLIDNSVLTAEEHINRTKTKDTILLVDDNVEVLDYLEMVFQHQYNIARAENGVKALEYLSSHEPDLIISDVMMPEMDGVTLCKAVKSNVETSHIPLILLSAKSAIENALVGLKTGADDYVAKPFYPELLRAKVFNFIEAKRRFIEKFTQVEGGVVVPKNITHNPLDEEFLNNVITSINANIDNEEFSVEELGSMVAMSRSNLFRKLKAITGQTPVEFIYFIRMNKAMELLLKRKHSISQISFEVGFKSPSSFTKSFKKQFGKAPSDYLNEAIAKQKEIDGEDE